MTGTKQVDLDAVEELRLRRWARQNYVAPEQRDASWHAIVLDEMHRRDTEASPGSDQGAYRALVPLAPHAAQRQPSAYQENGLWFRIDAADQSETK